MAQLSAVVASDDLDTPIRIDRPTPRKLGIAVLVSVTLLFSLLLAFGSEEPATSDPNGRVAVADADPAPPGP